MDSILIYVSQYSGQAYFQKLSVCGKHLSQHRFLILAKFSHASNLARVFDLVRSMR